ncbi:N-acetylglucosaminyl transferase component-domain-containing protein [Irpex lacteus]|nr:N-acetylglucosaminyl transferase component-domain-containing protein [Irpex lacteus]
MTELCGAFPTILGRVSGLPREPTMDTVLSSSTLQLLRSDDEVYESSTAQYTLIRYTRPRLRHLEMYTLDASLSPTLRLSFPNHSMPSRRGPNLCLHDFTRPSIGQPLFNQTVVNQMNVGRTLSQTVSELHERPAHKNTEDVAAVPLDGGPISLKIPIVSTSALALQVMTRLRQLRYLYSKFPPPSYRRRSMSTDVITSFIGFYNCLWLILNDIIIGITVRSLVHENAALLSNTLRGCIRRFLIEDIQRTLLWLNNWPAGLKLNTELSGLYCHSLMSIMGIWNHALMNFVLPHIDGLVYISGAIGFCGVTMTVALLTDILSLVTAHMHLCYKLCLAVFAKQLDAISALSKLFRGKRQNMLRKRTDSWLFDVDQLLFGTVLFTLLAFISPTTMVYYAFFALLRLCTLVAYDMLNVFLNLVNEFPLFALMLHVKDPFRLPEGLVMKISSNERSSYIQNRTIPLQLIFGHYSIYITSLLTHLGE